MSETPEMPDAPGQPDSPDKRRPVPPRRDKPRPKPWTRPSFVLSVIAVLVIAVIGVNLWQSNRTRCREASPTAVTYIHDAARNAGTYADLTLENARQYGPVTVNFEWPVLPGVPSDLPNSGPGYIVVGESPSGAGAWAFDKVTGEGGLGGTVVQPLNDAAAAVLSREAAEGIAQTSDIESALACLS
jgi:hypothetical protein